MSLARYAIDPVTGFIPGNPPLVRLPAYFDAWEAIATDLPALIRSRRLRPALAQLPHLDAARLASDAEHERAFLVLCHFANAWVWGGDEPHLRIPATVAVPLCALSEILGRPPIAHYASMTLRNWRRLDPSAPLSVDNAHTQIAFLGGVDEDWFFIASMGVELAGAPLLPIIESGLEAAVSGTDDELTSLLGRFAAGLEPVLTALDRIREWCDPDIYYKRARPFLAGWPAPGVVYEGVWDEPRRYIGGSAAQSSLLQSFDAFLGVAHPEAPAGAYLKAVRAYMPVPHRAFLEDVERTSRVRQRAASGTPALREAYNACLDRLDTFRERHMQLAHDYIIRPSGAPKDATGTGGTSLTAFLRGAQHSTTSSRL